VTRLRVGVACGIALAFGLASSLVPARAHTTTKGLATLTVDGAALTWRLTLLPSELPADSARWLAGAGEGERDAVQRADHELRSRLSIRADGATCRPGRARFQGSGLGDGRVTFELELRCPAPPSRLVVRDDAFDVLGEHHRTLVRVDGGGRGQDAALLPDAREATFALRADVPVFSGSFVRLGIEHILTGWDHLAFLTALLLGGGGVLSLLTVVTAFTVAHSVTLALAVFGVLRVPDRLVECVIALSIAWVAVENVRGGAGSRRWLVSFAFGLVHGLGFAGALQELALPAGRLAWGLVGFNVGVELGQAAALAVLFALLVGVRRLGWERPVVRAGSTALACVGVVWFVGRLIGV
jgi:HupE / UreJ protein